MRRWKESENRNSQESAEAESSVERNFLRGVGNGNGSLPQRSGFMSPPKSSYRDMVGPPTTHAPDRAKPLVVQVPRGSGRLGAKGPRRFA